MVDLTKRQQEIFDFIKRYSAEYGYPPTVRDIGKAVGLTSSSTVHAHLANLEKLGLLRRDPSKPRAIELLDRVAGRRRAVELRSSRAPRRPAARRPGRRRLSRSSPRRTSRSTCRCPAIAGGEDGEYVLRVRGESMKDAGILEGDYVVVRPQDTAADGEIVVALVGEEATVKRFFRETDHVRLQPENATMEPIRSKDVRGPGARRRRLPERHLMTAAPCFDLRLGARRSSAACATATRRRMHVAARHRAHAHRPTLDEVLSAYGRACRRTDTVTCPVCSGEMAAPLRHPARAPVGGRCQRCGSRAGRRWTGRPLPSTVQARQPRRERQPVEESPDTTGQGGRETDPGKPAGKCHRNTPPMAGPLQSSAQARLKWCGKSAPASR